MTQVKCGYIRCFCPAPLGSAYCSVYCETAGGSAQPACGCDHPSCTASQSPDSAEARQKRERMLDKTLADSYPASDPPSSIPDPSEETL